MWDGVALLKSMRRKREVLPLLSEPSGAGAQGGRQQALAPGPPTQRHTFTLLTPSPECTSHKQLLILSHNFRQLTRSATDPEWKHLLKFTNFATFYANSIYAVSPKSHES